MRLPSNIWKYHCKCWRFEATTVLPRRRTPLSAAPRRNKLNKLRKTITFQKDKARVLVLDHQHSSAVDQLMGDLELGELIPHDLADGDRRPRGP